MCRTKLTLLALSLVVLAGAFAIVQTLATKQGVKTMGLDPTTHTRYLPTAESAGSFMILEVRKLEK